MSASWGPASLPHVKGAFNLNWSDGPFNIRGTMNLVGGMRDFNNPSRAVTFTVPQAGFCTALSPPPPAPQTCTALRTSPFGASVAPWITWDLNAQYIWVEQNLQFNLSIDNILDKSPPFARTDYSYDAFTANPYGRTVKFGVTANLN